jgi:hypothetical protein
MLFCEGKRREKQSPLEPTCKTKIEDFIQGKVSTESIQKENNNDNETTTKDKFGYR